jgi:hypothetical protein
LREDEFFMYGRDIKTRQLDKQKEKLFDKAMLDFNNGLGFDRTNARN